jgi:hypothetical protein
LREARVSIFEMLPIMAPTPPLVPVPPVPPKPPASTVFDPQAIARELAEKLRDKKRDEVLKAVKDLPAANREQLRAALIRTLWKDRLKLQGLELRRIIRFVNVTVAPNDAVPAVKESGGKLITDGIQNATLSTGGKVTVRTGIKANWGNISSDDAYCLTYQGSDAPDMQWLQLIWREVVQVFPVKGKSRPPPMPVKSRLDNPSTVNLPYLLTTDPESATKSGKRRWNCDSPSGDSPFYENKSPVTRTASKLAMFDFPSALPSKALATSLFKSANPPEKLEARFHAETYLVRGLDVLYRVKLDLNWDIGRDLVQPPAKVKAAGDRVSALDAPQRACIAYQHPAFDYLPGPLVAPPLPADEFDLLQDLHEADWSNAALDIDRFKDIASLVS